MKKIIPLLVMLLIFSTAFSSKIDPNLLREFKEKTYNPNAFYQMGQTEKVEKFLVWYKGNLPKGKVIGTLNNFPIAEYEGTLSDVYKIANDSHTIYIVPNVVFRPFLNETTNYSNSIIGDYPQVFSKYNGSGVNVEVIDSGANWSLPIFSNVSHEIYSLNPLEGNHGNVVISEIVSMNDSYLGIARGTKIYDARIFSNDYTDLYRLISAIDWGISNGVDIESMSLGVKYTNGFGDKDPYLQLLFDEMFSLENNTLFVIAAGNTPGNFTISQPGSSTPMNVITVGAVYKNGTLWENSSRGPLESNRIKPDVCATGVLYSFNSDGSVHLWLGTSMATPLVSGAAAVLKQANRDLTPKEIKLLLMEGATNKSVWSCGAGIINVSKSLDLLNKTIAIVDDNYLGYVGNYSTLNITLKNFGSPQWINVSIYYYNWTLWNDTVVFVNGTNETSFVLKIPNLDWNESYGWIILNDSARLPFSWAKAEFIQPNQFYSEINITNRFYTINYTLFLRSVPTPLFEVVGPILNNSVIINHNVSWYEITPFDKDLSGFSFKIVNSSQTFKVYPFSDIQIENGKFFNLRNYTVNVSLFNYDYSRGGNNVTVSSNNSTLFVVSASSNLMVENCTNSSNCNPVHHIYISDSNVVGSLQEGVWIDPNQTFVFYSPEGVSLKVYELYSGPYTIENFTSRQLPIADLYVFGNEFMQAGISKANVSCSAKNGFSNLKCEITLPTNTNGSFDFYVYTQGEGLFSNDQISISYKKVYISNGKGNVSLLVYSNNPYDISYCLGNLTVLGGNVNCNGFSGYVLSTGEKASRNSIESWLSDIVEEVSKMLNYYVGG